MVKHNSLFLFLALACFVGIILIFVFDGYMGVYDRLVMDNGQYKQTVEGDQWAQQEKFGGMVTVGVEKSGQVAFTYTVENHRFSVDADNLDVSLWYNQTKTADLLSKQLSISAFNKTEFTWTIISANIVPAGYPAEQSYNIILKIKRGNLERDVNVNIYPSSNMLKVVPPGVPVPVITIPPAPAK